MHVKQYDVCVQKVYEDAYGYPYAQISMMNKNTEEEAHMQNEHMLGKRKLEWMDSEEVRKRQNGAIVLSQPKKMPRKISRAT